MVQREQAEEGCGYPREVMVLLAGLAGLLVYFQYTTLGKFNVLKPAVRYDTFRDFLLTVRDSVLFSRDDALVAGLIALFCLALGVLEVWRGRVSLCLAVLFRSERRTRVGLALLCGVLVRFYFARGALSWAGDTSAHVGYAWLAARSFALGEFPIWTNYFGTGTPYLQFYGFLFFYLVGAVDLLVRDLFVSLKVVLWGSHVVSGMGMYLFVRLLCRSRRAGFVAGLAYVLSFWHTQQVLVMGRLPLSVFYAVLPFSFYFFERLRFSRARVSALVGGAMTLGMLAFTHPGYAFWATGFWMGFGAVRLLSLRRRTVFLPWARWAGATLAGGLVFGAYLTAPMWAERAYTELHGGFSHLGYPDPSWSRILVWSNYRFTLFPLSEADNHWYGGYLGLSLFGLALFGALSPIFFRPERRMGVGGAIGFAGALVLVFGYRWPVIGDLAVVQAFEAGRYLLFVAFFMAVLAGVCVRVATGIWRSHTARIAGGVVLFMLADLGPTTFQHPYLSPGHAARLVNLPPNVLVNLKAASKAYEDGMLPNYRGFYATGGVHRGQATFWMVVHSGMPSFLGLYNEQPRVASEFCQPAEALLTPILKGWDGGSELPSEVDVLLYLLNIRRVYALQVGPQKSGYLLDWAPDMASPIVVAPEIAGWNDALHQKETLFKQLAAMSLDPERGACKRILVRHFEGRENLETSPGVKVLDHRVWNQRVELEVRVTEDCFARLSYAFYPYLGVTVDGREVKPFQTAGRFVALKLDRGDHRIVLEPHLSLLRRGLLTVDLILMGVAVVVVIRRRRRFQK